MKNHLQDQTSPYLLQHADNPVDWYPWSTEAFAKAKEEDKPIFLSIGYSTCHWCHVMARESFADAGVASLLNRYFVSIKVDREERPDIDAIYMAVCQAFTGGGGWPLSLFLTPEQKPFFAGTYFPKAGRGNQMGFTALLAAIAGGWREDRKALLQSAEKIVTYVREMEAYRPGAKESENEATYLVKRGLNWFVSNFDAIDGGFGSAPKFPMGHQLLFLLDYHGATGDEKSLAMAEKTLAQMYKGGLFDHIGYGFCRYSTDRRFLVPHFEKMLYDNALLILAYSKAYSLTGASFYARVAKETAEYVLREMRGSDGGFYSAQDADSQGEEGKYYTLTYEEILALLGQEAGNAFCSHYGITPLKNFEGKNIPNLLHDPAEEADFDGVREAVYAYRLGRYPLHLDDKCLTAWNGLMIVALVQLFRVLKEEQYLDAARKAETFLHQNLMEEACLRVSFRAGQKGGPGFLEDHAFYGLGLMALYDATLNVDYLDRALALVKKTIQEFYDEANGGFFLSGQGNERLILSTKPTYDGALPSGNSAMAHLLLGLSRRTKSPQIRDYAEKQWRYMLNLAGEHPAGYSFFMSALLSELYPPVQVVCVLADPADREKIRKRIPLETVISMQEKPTEGYNLLHGKTTFYTCKGHACLPPTNDMEAAL
ncbi:MAG: thioredoxin domain-containing protein [Clostridia bacterium]|nr:thioredoxin domain-containing protein [Clostridia bacterium]